MVTIFRALIVTLLFIVQARAQNYPAFGPEIKVFISGYSGDAMEPFLSPDGTTLFFNSLNDGVQTRLYYATRIDDSTFTYVGEVNGANEANNPQLNAVASLDTTNNFVWVSVRGYPGNMDNLHRGDYSNGTVTNVNRVHGSFYIYQPGYIIMDAAVTYDGSELYYCNAFFDTCVVPCAASIGIAARVNDSTYNTLSNSSGLLQHVNDTAYCVYAPQLSVDGLELYFTRYLIGTLNTELCVSVRNAVTDTFSVPQVLVSEFPEVPEAPTLNTTASLLYYHKKSNGTYTLFLRQRILTDVNEHIPANRAVIYPNPANDVVHIPTAQPGDVVRIYNSCGGLMSETAGDTQIITEGFPEGMYMVQVITGENVSSVSFTIIH